MRRLRDARHEAAHAVIAESLGIRVCSVVLKEDDGDGTRGYCVLDRRSRAPYLAQAVVFAAGSVVEHMHRHRPRQLFASGDLELIEKLKFGHPLSFALVCDLTHSYLKHPRARRNVERVASALLKRDLSGKEVRSLIRAS